MISSKIIFAILTFVVLMLGGCSNSHKESNSVINQTELNNDWTEDNLEVINFSEDYFTDYLAAKIKTEIITSSTSYISIELVDQDDEINIKSCSNAFELKVFLDNKWYKVPLVDNSVEISFT